MESTHTEFSDGDTPNELALVTVDHAIELDIEARSGRWDGLCERCFHIPWEAIIKPKIDAHRDYSIRLDHHLNADSCRVCRLFSRIYSDIPGVLPENLIPYDSKPPLYRFQHRLLRDQWIMDDERYGVRWLLTDRNPQDEEVLAEHRRVQPACTNFDRVKSWIRICEKEHGEVCKPTLTAFIQHLRVIDVVEGKVVLAPANCKFVALSYVWGSGSIAQDNGVESLHTVPKTIEDAKNVTMRLGYRYLWVDRYCVDQADEQETHMQVRQMGAIYSAAQITIVACAGDNPTYGLPGVDTETRTILDFQHEQVGHNWIVAQPSSATLTIRWSMWASRAWTYQEGYLSKRRLFFTDDEAVLICNQDIFSFTLVVPPKPTEILKGRNRELELVQYLFPPRNSTGTSGMFSATQYLATYSTRALSYDSDALSAISGILNTQLQHKGKPVCHVSGVLFVAVDDVQKGVWVALDWYHLKPCRRRLNIPSWSPLAWDGIMSSFNSGRVFVPRDCQLAIWNNDLSTAIERLAEKSYETHKFDGSQEKQLLDITAYTVELAPSSVTRQSDTQELVFTEPQFVLNMDNDTEMVILPYWDEVPTQDNSTGPMLGLIFAQDLSIRSFINRNPPVVLVIEPRGAHYERIGIFPEQFVGSRAHLRDRRTHARVTPDFTSALSDTCIWLQHAKKQRILLA